MRLLDLASADRDKDRSYPQQNGVPFRNGQWPLYHPARSCHSLSKQPRGLRQSFYGVTEHPYYGAEAGPPNSAES
ncbi:hypothetical protein PG994_013399 [Apiospora phragmitis]|uniref:Uncharacterized protein n=1 Tax=Apiospora phragmitis TaxID=2905665 RepID=A0ABR1T8I4_9PEZI